jgi:hypothetical protein
MSDENKHSLPIPTPPRAPKDAKVKRTSTRKKDGELLSISEWALRKLEQKHGEVSDDEQ